MEVKTPPKQLLQHALPVLMITALLFVVSTAVLSGRGALGLDQAQNGALATGLVTRVFRVQPTANGLARITLNNSGPSMTGGDVSQAGRTAQLAFELQ